MSWNAIKFHLLDCLFLSVSKTVEDVDQICFSCLDVFLV